MLVARNQQNNALEKCAAFKIGRVQIISEKST